MPSPEGRVDVSGRFEEAWDNAQKWYRVPGDMRNAFLCVYLSGRVDGMAYLTDKKLEQMYKTNAVRRHIKDSVRNMEGQ